MFRITCPFRYRRLSPMCSGRSYYVSTSLSSAIMVVVVRIGIQCTQCTLGRVQCTQKTKSPDARESSRLPSFTSKVHWRLSSAWLTTSEPVFSRNDVTAFHLREFRDRKEHECNVLICIGGYVTWPHQRDLVFAYIGPVPKYAAYIGTVPKYAAYSGSRFLRQWPFQPQFTTN